jgi:hypothetical protein
MPTEWDGDADRLGFDCRTSQADNLSFCFYLIGSGHFHDPALNHLSDSCDLVQHRQPEAGVTAETRAGRLSRPARCL